MKYLLDTSICVFFLRGELSLDEIFKEKGVENCFISEITVVELRFGAENSKYPDKALDAFINGLSIIPILGSIKNMLKRK
jgi:tRNA(fMet)-specific endonuclease VapC